MPSNHLILCCPPSPPAFNPSQHHLFQWVDSSHQVAKVLELQLQHQSFSKYSGMISFRNDWFDLLAVQGILKSLLQAPQFKSIISSALSLLYGPISNPYIIAGKPIALTMQNSDGKVMSLLLNMLSRFVISFLPRSIF